MSRTLVRARRSNIALGKDRQRVLLRLYWSHVKTGNVLPPYSALAHELGAPPSNIGKHLALLRDFGLIRTEIRDRRLYAIPLENTP